jgi:DNA polymerase III subunit epsilon
MVEHAWASRLDGAERWNGAIPHDPSPWRRANGER